MSVSHRETSSVRQSVRAALGRRDRVVLAVSGGLDSMVLLDAAAATVPRERLTVATFDHATGPAASAARAHVERHADALGIEYRGARASETPVGEAALRDARWDFLRRVAAERSAAICTAHTEDDQIETILMRIMRGAGTRGITALYAESPIVRPLLAVRRRQLVAYARAQALTWIEDPSNATGMYLRNRVRGELLPALRHVRPGIDGDLLALARKASRWRQDVDRLVDETLDVRLLPDGAGLDVLAPALDNSEELARLCWPAVAARIGVTLDRRGLERLSAFTVGARVGARIQLAGGWQVVRSREAFQLRRCDAEENPTPVALAVSESTEWGAWSFRSEEHRVEADRDPWAAWLPADRPLMVRRWEAGDAMAWRDAGAPTKVKHLLTDAGVTGHHRAGWPVVLAGDQIVWVPGVRRVEAATARSGRPGLPFLCEYIHR
jgi:tRNA(Ile)-lysidine synthase